MKCSVNQDCIAEYGDCMECDVIRKVCQAKICSKNSDCCSSGSCKNNSCSLGDPVYSPWDFDWWIYILAVLILIVGLVVIAVLYHLKKTHKI